MFRKLIILTATMPMLMFLAAGPAHAGKHDPIYTPEAIQVPAGKNDDDVKMTMKKVLLDKGWEVREVGPGHIQSMYTKSSKRDSYTAVIDIHYDAMAIRINYMDSENLNYNKGDNTIHGTYNKWVRNAEKYIRAGIATH